MRRIIILTILFTLMTFLWAVEPNIDGYYPSQTFTAYKSDMSGNLPESIYGIQLFTPDSKEINGTTLMTLSESARSAEYTLFTWNASGTAAGDVTVSFTFSPLQLRDGNTVLATIPYEVSIEHQSTTVDGIAVAVNRDVESISGRRCSFTKAYRFAYSDTVNTLVGTSGSYSTAIKASTSVSTSSKTISVKYNLASATLVKNSSGETITQDGKAIAYPYSVTDLWARLGQCVVKLNITPDGKNNSGTAYRAGWYNATVTVGITAP